MFGVRRCKILTMNGFSSERDIGQNEGREREADYS